MPGETRRSQKPGSAAPGILAVSLCVVLLVGRSAISQQDETALARDILSSAAVKGGLIVHIGCGDPAWAGLTAALRVNDRYLVHGLDADPANVERARKHIRSLGAYGNVSVDTFAGNPAKAGLPYIDNFVNLVVVSGECQVAREEIMRVLTPNGVAIFINRQSKIEKQKFIKPWPKEIDEWTHYLHDPTNNAVAHDTVIGPPRRYQWHGAPRWARHHDHMASMSALVSAKGRIFYIFDEGPTASVILPPKWFLAGRDAFNGTILWKRPIEKWHTQLWPLKSGPADLPRRLVAVEDRVYVTLGFDAPVSILDAATGDTLRTLEGTDGAQEIVVSDGIVFLVVGKPDARDTLPSVADIRKRQQEDNCDGADRAVVAVQAETGEVLWRKQGQVVPLTLAADGQRVFFYDNDKVICLRAKTGEQLWASESLPRSDKFPSDYAPTLVVYNDVVLFCGGKNMVPHYGAQDFMQALSVETGKTLWTSEHPPSGYQSPEDLFVASGLVWTGATTQGEDSGEFTGRDPQTGEVRKRYVPAEKRGWGHHRCHRSKATDRYILTGRSGIEFLDVDSTDWVGYRWVRGACLYGIMPANGLIYAPPHDCACFIEGKLSAFSAVAPESPTWKPPREVSDEGRLQRGPAYDVEIGNRESEIENNDWPMYRHDTRRSGHAKTSVPADVGQVWQADLGGRLSSPVLADGKLFVAAIDAHTIHALDADSGKEAWTYTAGGRVDSPPTIWEGRVLFGSADGWVYCLRAADGRLIWRFRAAPEDRRMMGFEQVESVWPVSGSVLVYDGVVYCVAGRSSYLDGGMRLLRLDAKTGQKLSETLLDETGQEGKGLDVAAPDILSSDGKHVYMKSLRFSMDGASEGIATKDVTKQAGEDAHLFSPTSLLDGAWFHRSYWIYGRMYAGSAMGYYLAGLMTPGGRILTFDDETVYGYGRKAQYYRWTTLLEYVLFAAEKERGDFEPPQRRGRTSSIQAAASESLNPGSVPTTIEAWVNAETGNGAILARGGGKTDGIALLFDTGKPQFIVRTGEQITTAACNDHLVNRWVHLAGVLTAEGKAELYVDGKLVGSAHAPRLPKLGPKAGIDIGLDTGGAVGDYRPSFGFKGMMDEVRVFNGPLTAGEIQQHAANPGEAAAGGAALVLRYSFDKDKANPKGEGKVTDESGRGNDGVTEGLRLAEGKAGRGGKFIGAKPSILQLPFAVTHRWAKGIPMTVRAMALADKTLFAAGPPDLLDEEEAAKQLTDPKVQAALAEQAAALDGKRGALLWAVSSSDGTKLAEQKLAAMPVFDGMIAAQGRLYLSTTGGQVLCLGAQ